MKHIDKMTRTFGLLLWLLTIGEGGTAQTDSTKPEVSINIHHFIVNNSLQYLVVDAKTKIGGKWQPTKGLGLALYLDSNKNENLIGKIHTDSDGKAKAIIPPGLKSVWDATPEHKFIGVTQGPLGEGELITESAISKAKILIDTSNEGGARMVNVRVQKFEDGEWSPAKDVELKIGIRRSGGDLKVGDDETYTTDSLGQVAAEFKRDSLPADKKNSLTLIAKIEDNDSYGNLSIEKTVPWGVYKQPANNFGSRALWAARGRAPVWLMFMAYSIIAAVWGVVLYLVLQIIRIKKLGTKEDARKGTEHSVASV